MILTQKTTNLILLYYQANLNTQAYNWGRSEMTPLADFEWLEALKFDHFCNDRVYGDIDLAYTMSMQSNLLLQ
jgi:hypothetical protein